MTLLEYHSRDRIAYITLNRPEKRNALSFELVAELKEAFVRAEKDEQVKIIILKANGDAFCAGADLAYLQQLQNYSYEENVNDSNHLKELFTLIYHHPKMIIAQVQGHALAGGCGLATVCDFVFAVPKAKFGYTEVKIGFIPAIVMVFLIRKLGEAKAKELLLSGDLISAESAWQLGMINRVVDPEKLEEEVFEFAQHLASTNSAQSLEVTKRMISTVQSLSLDEALDYAAKQNAKARGSDDCKRGIAAFLNKEKIIW
jgi:methylglutaconyl-CoA hydratase